MIAPGENMEPRVSAWLGARGWVATSRNGSNVLWKSGGDTVLVPDVIEFDSPTWRGVLSRMAAKSGSTSFRVAAEVDRRIAAEYAADAWHDFQQWLALLSYDQGIPLIDEAGRYLKGWLDAHPVDLEVNEAGHPTGNLASTGKPPEDDDW